MDSMVTYESRFSKNIVYVGDSVPAISPAQARMWEDQSRRGSSVEWNLLYAMEDSVVKGSFGMGGSWMIGMTGTEPVQIELAHTHDADETLGFAGSDIQNPDDLGAEIELWLEDEKFVLTRSCLVFIPRGTKHCPLFVRKVERPFFFFGSTVGENYERTWEEDYR
jgi:hypothetical protein